MSADQKANRINFLSSHDKLEEAVAFAKENYSNESGVGRSRVLMAGATAAFRLYQQSQKRPHLLQMFEMLNVVVKEGLPDAPAALFMAAQAHGQIGNLNKAVAYAKKAARIAPSPKDAAAYYSEVIALYVKDENHEKVIQECDVLLSKYPQYENRDRIEKYKAAADQAVMRRSAIEAEMNR